MRRAEGTLFVNPQNLVDRREGPEGEGGWRRGKEEKQTKGPLVWRRRDRLRAAAMLAFSGEVTPRAVIGWGPFRWR